MPIKLWVRGYIQEMGAPALAMLLLLLADRNLDGRPTWWSVDRFKTFCISSTNRTTGTKELETMRLVSVTKALVDPSRSGTSFRRERVRNNYRLRGAARPAAMIESAQAHRKAARKKAAASSAKKTAHPSR